MTMAFWKKVDLIAHRPLCPWDGLEERTYGFVLWTF